MTRLRVLTLLVLFTAPVALDGCYRHFCELEIETDALPDGTVGQFYAFELDSDCGGDFWFLRSGNLPPGIALEDDGDLVGTPTRRGEFIFTVGLEDLFTGELVFKGFVLTIN